MHFTEKKIGRFGPASILRLFSAGCLICVFFIFSAAAKSLTEYRTDIGFAANAVRGLLNPEIEETESAEAYENLERETLADIRKHVPASERIEWESSVIETDNRWLSEKLQAFEEEPKDSEQRERILTEIGERLDSLEQKIIELEQKTASSGRTKDEDKRKLAEILNREEFQKLDEKDKSLFQRIVEAILKWIEKLFSNSRPPERTQGAGAGPLRAVLLYLILFGILGGIGFLIYKFAPRFFGNYRVRKTKEREERIILGEKLAPDEGASDLFRDAERLAREGNLRGAIRKGYIALLCELGDRKIIGLAQHKTNRDYLKDVRGRKELFQDMSGLTSNFERHWYGFDPAENSDWEEFKSGYRKAVGNSR
ncbi:MAG: DUF4129 domain-containing protein [Pyrinomonadaceae bacterium]